MAGPLRCPTAPPDRLDVLALRMVPNHRMISKMNNWSSSTPKPWRAFGETPASGAAGSIGGMRPTPGRLGSARQGLGEGNEDRPRDHHGP